MIREPPPFFHRGPSPLARLTFFLLFAIGLMIADHRFHALATVRLSLSTLVQPVQQVASWPGQLLSRFRDYFTSQEKLLAENRELKAKILEQSALSQEARLLRELDRLLMEETGLPVIVADDPLTCVVRGSGRALEEMDKLGTVFTND